MRNYCFGYVFCLLLVVLVFGCQPEKGLTNPDSYTGWAHYLGDPGRSHYSTLSAFSPDNVTQLEVAWEYETPDTGQMQMNPIIVDSVLYGVSAAMRPFAINARTGKELWVFGDSLNAWYATSRGVSYWEKGEDRRIYYTIGSDLWALDALSGKPVDSFGESGKISLKSGLPTDARDKFVTSSSPGTIYKDLIIMPTRVAEGAGAAPGDIMAFDVLSGKLAWVFHTLPYPGEAGAETWELENVRNSLIGGANNWAGMALDAENEIIYVPTGSAAPDFYGGNRKGANLYSNCLLALNANTGERIWHYQFTHHDLWDRDPPAPPNLLSVKNSQGATIPAVAQITKQGYVFVFDRFTGESLFEIEERPVPESDLRGEAAWPTQPVPKKPLPFARQAQSLTENDISPYAPNPEGLKALLRSLDRRLYAPPGLDPVLLLPGYDGGAEWGGAAADPQEGILYVNSNEMAWFLQMSETESEVEGSLGAQLYNTYCLVCHRADRSGMPQSGFPSLQGLELRKSTEEVSLLIRQGKGMMPGFPQIKPEQEKALLAFLYNREEDKKEVRVADAGLAQPELPYKHLGYHKFLDENGRPAINPPWGTLHAIDLNSGEYIWSVTLGDTPELKEKGRAPTGSENYGGPVVTENGLLFIAATKDGYFRAFNRHNGKLLWEYKLPVPAFATPAIYETDGRQFIALACGGEKLGTPKGNKIIAFSLKTSEK
ncbi:pyrroloquinoline quinone-dependent dehydrogenase [Robiginitalea sp. IMCC44478]|uniref:pyrroloquinoline quinone-dependent dehydrogenase n=1 Tax=Robiginitalea sp. IMCC44478 TaxID=3459122 RepID=UPI0040432C9D